MYYNFDEEINRKNTQSSKWDNVGARVGNPNALPMWVADTDFRCPKPIVDAVMARAEHMVYGYPYVAPEFKEATVNWITKRHGWKIINDWIVFATGIVPIINTMVQAFSEPGDEIIIQRPVYHPFGYAIEDNNRIMSNNKLIYKNGKYFIDFDDLEKKASSPKAKLMVLCNPHNPVGRVWLKKELKRIAEICNKYNIIIVSDEIHSDLVLFGNKHICLASMDEKYAKNIVTCFAPSKTFNIAGLRASSVVIPNVEIQEKLEMQLKKNRSIQQNIFALPAYIAAYNECEDYLEQLIPYLEENVRFLHNFLKNNIPKIKLVYPEATFLTWLDCADLKLNNNELADFFINKCLVAINRGDSFGADGGGFVRLNIGCPRSRLEKALQMIKEQYNKIY